MPLPPTIRVKLSSEDAGAVSMTPVVLQELPTRELIEHMLGITGKDEPRIREILQRGTFVSGGSRFRWPGRDASLEEVRALLTSFPDPNPLLPFSRERCVRATLRGDRQTVDLPREVATRTGLFVRESFWELLMDLAEGAVYGSYSYRDRADRYVRDFSVDEGERLRRGSALIAFNRLRDQIRSMAIAKVELYVPRPKSEAGAR